MLTWALHALAGPRIGPLRETTAAQVTIPLNQRRHAQVTIPTDDPMAPHAMRPLAVVLRAWWFKRPIFAGPITIPRFSQDGETIQLNATDPGFRLATLSVNQRSDGALLAYQAAVDQSEILARLIDHVRPTAAEIALGVPDIPIIRASLPATKNRDRGYEPGKNIWDAIVELSEVQEGVDFELEPLAPRADGYLCALNTYPRQGADQTNQVKFTAGFAWEDSTITWEPAGDGVVNRSTWQGQSEEGQPPPTYTSNQPESQVSYGIYGAYEGAADISVTNTLAEHAQGQVGAAAFPVDFFDIVPAVEGRGYEIDPVTRLPMLVEGRQFGTPPAFGPGPDFDYFVGDTIACHARIPPAIDGVFTGRVTDAVLSEAPETGDGVVALTIGPDIPLSAVT